MNDMMIFPALLFTGWLLVVAHRVGIARANQERVRRALAGWLR